MLDVNPDRPPVVWTPLGREVEYRVVYEHELSSADSPLLIDLGELPGWDAKYRIRVEVEQLPRLRSVAAHGTDET